ncbi:MAG: DNA-directed RNA polymerase subunit alpha C-terminal domain-containing protein [Candidatus Absconditabacterales bacterium]
MEEKNLKSKNEDQENSQEMVNRYTDLKTILRCKIMELQKIMEMEEKEKMNLYDSQHMEAIKKINNFYKKMEKEGKNFDIDKNRKKLEEIDNLVKVHMSWSSDIVYENTKYTIKRAQKALIKNFRLENKSLIDEYKKLGAKVRANPEFKEMPRYLRDKERIEKQVNSVRIGEKIPIEDMIPYCYLNNTRTKVISDYIKGGDPIELANKMDLWHRRIRLIRKAAMKQILSRMISGDLDSGPIIENLNISKESSMKPIIEVAELSQRAKNALISAEINTVGELFQYSKQDLLKFRGFGKKMVDEIENFKSHIKELNSSSV